MNATQAYDKSPSQIVLASYLATSTINTPTKSLGDSPKDANITILGTTSVQILTAGELGSLGSKLSDQDVLIPAGCTLSLSWTPTAEVTLGSRRKNTKAPEAPVDTVLFSGVGGAWGDPRSKKTKEIYYGAMTVGTGLYREWQGKYAVLKVDLLTNKAILRVYNE